MAKQVEIQTDGDKCGPFCPALCSVGARYVCTGFGDTVWLRGLERHKACLDAEKREDKEADNG